MEEIGPKKRTTDPIVTGTSVLAIKYKDGVMMMSDTLASYGSMARFCNLERIRKVNNTTIIGAGGEYSDFQTIMKYLEEANIRDFCEDDGSVMTAKEVYHYMSRIMYNCRSRVNPLWNQVIIGGILPQEKQVKEKEKEKDKEKKKEVKSKEGSGAGAGAGPVTSGDKDEKELSHIFLGTVDMYGSTYEDNILATGYGKYIAVPLLRKSWRPSLTEDEAKQLLEDCMRILFYRDCRTINKFHLARITKDGPSISKPYSLSTQWEFSRFIDPHSQ